MNQLYIEITENLRIINESGVIPTLRKFPKDLDLYPRWRFSVHNSKVRWDNVGLKHVPNLNGLMYSKIESEHMKIKIANFIRWCLSNWKDIIIRIEKELHSLDNELMKTDDDYDPNWAHYKLALMGHSSIKEACRHELSFDAKVEFSDYKSATAAKSNVACFLNQEVFEYKQIAVDKFKFVKIGYFD